MAAATVAIAVGAGLKFVGDYMNRKAATKAADKAVEAQTGAADEAKAELRQAYGPYMQTGGSAMSTLGGLWGLNPAPGQKVGGAEATAIPVEPVPTERGGSVFKRIADQAQERKAVAEKKLWGDEPHTLGTLFERIQRGGTKQASSQTRSGYTRMRAPEGDEEQDVPDDLVPMLEEQGAQRL